MQELITGIGVKIHGHLKITEYASRDDYDAGRESRVWVNKRNAVNKDNAAILLAKALTNRADGAIAYMVFGNGGAHINNSGNVILETPNVNTNNANLYNPVFFQFVNDLLGATPGNQMSVRHITNSLFTDVDIRCLIGVNQPFSQGASNQGIGDPVFSPAFTGINLNEATFAFNEIGLKLADGTLITHVLFSPVLKAANALIEVVYTLRFAIVPPFIPAPPPVNVTIHIVGVEAVSGAGEFTVILPPPPANMGWRAMQSGRIMEATLGSQDDEFIPVTPDSFDNLGNIVIANHVANASTGETLYTLNFTGLWNAIDTWFGSPLVQRTPDIGVSGNSCILGSICGGKYILAYAEATSPHDPSGDIFKWFALLDPQSTVGNPVVLGAVGYNTFAIGVPYQSVMLFSSTGAQTDADPIIVIGDNGAGGGTFYIELLPSPTEIKSGTYRGGWAGTNPYGGFVYGPCEIPYNYWYPIAVANLSENLYVQNSSGSFALPTSGGGTNLYFYFNKPYIVFCETGGFLLFPCPEVANVIGPANPNGAIIKIPLSAAQISFAGITRTAASGNQHDGMLLGTLGGATANYTVDNANWQLSGGSPAIPFLDETTYVSQSGEGNEDTTGGIIAAPVTVQANELTVIGIIYPYRNGNIQTIEVNLQNSATGNVVLGIYSTSQSLVGTATNVVTNPSAGNVTFTFASPVPVVENTGFPFSGGYYLIAMLADTNITLNGAPMPLTPIILANLTGIQIGCTESQSYSATLPSTITINANSTFQVLPWAQAAYTTAPHTGSNFAYDPMPGLVENISGTWNVVFTMIDGTNRGWASSRLFTYNTGSAIATQQSNLIGPLDLVSGFRGKTASQIVNANLTYFGFQQPQIDRDLEGQMFNTALGTFSTIGAKSTTAVSFNGNTSVTLASPTGLPTGTGAGTISFWYNPLFTSVAMQFLSGTNCPMSIKADGTGNMVFRFQNAGNTQSCTFNIFIEGDSGIFLLNGWHHFCVSWNMNLEEPYLVYLQDGDSVGAIPQAPNAITGGGGPFVMDYAGCTSWNFYGPVNPVQGFEGYATEFWFAPGVFTDLNWGFQYMNFAGPAVEYSLNQFEPFGQHPQINFPAYMGAHGELPLTQQPVALQRPFVYLTGNPGFPTNLGYGGTTVASGATPDAPTNPY